MSNVYISKDLGIGIFLFDDRCLGGKILMMTIYQYMYYIEILPVKTLLIQ